MEVILVIKKPRAMEGKEIDRILWVGPRGGGTKKNGDGGKTFS